MKVSFPKTNRILFICNPVSGGKRFAKPKSFIEAIVRGDQAADMVYTEYAGQAEQLARDADADIVVAVGGDGTVNEVARGIAGSEKKMGIIPCGSGNGLAYHLGIRGNYKKALSVIKEGHIVSMDEGVVCGRPFFCTCGVGLDANVSLVFSRSKKRGFLTYVTDTFKVWRQYKPEEYKIIVDEEEYTGKAMLVTVGNANQWGNQARITPLASVSDGLLDITILQPISILNIPVLAFLLMTGHLYRSRKIVHKKGRHMVINRSGPGVAHIDGDPVYLGDKLDITIKDGCVKVLVPCPAMSMFSARFCP